MLSKENKQKFINMLGDHLLKNNCTVIHARGDADTLIVDTAINSAENEDTIIYGEDTDFLILAIYHMNPNCHNLYMMPLHRTRKNRIWDIKEVGKTLSPLITENLLFLHCFFGCDTVSKIHGIGKGNIRKIETNIQLSHTALVFEKPNATASEIEEAGENFLSCNL